MKKTFALLILFCSFCTAVAQVQIQAQKCYGGSNQDYGYDVKTTADGGYIIAGYTSSNNGNVTLLHGNYDFWVVKTDAYGNIQWQKCLGGSNVDYAYSVIQTFDMGYIVAGYTSSNNGDVTGNYGLQDIWVVKLDQGGSIQWQKNYGGGGYDEARCIKQTPDGGYVLTGFVLSSANDVSGNHGSADVWVLRIDSTGNIIWQKCLGGSDMEDANSIQLTSDGGYVVAGYTSSTDGDVTGNHGYRDWWIVKLDSAANIQWQKCLGGTGDDQAYSMQLTSDGGFIVAGRTNSADGDVTGSHGGYDFWVVKLDSTGNVQWQRCMGGSGLDDAQSVVQTTDGGYIVVGRTSSVSGDVTGNHGGMDVWVVKLNNNGIIRWQQSLGGSNSDFGYSVCEISEGNYIAAGTTYSNNGGYIDNHGSCDYLIMKFIQSNISGLVFNDVNENGIKDPGEQGIPGHMVELDPGPQYTFTNNNGYYFFRGDASVTNTVTYVQQMQWYTTNVSYYNVYIDSFAQFIDTLDFAAVSRANVNDVSVYITGSATRAFFPTHYWLTYKNWGTTTMTGTINFEYDPLLTFTSSDMSPVSHSGNMLVFGYDTLGPGSQRTVRVDFQMPGVQNLGDTLFNNVWITPLLADTDIINNYDTLRQVITGSYDPNDKHAMPEGNGQSGEVLHGQRLAYTIRFQNTGTDTAFTVTIRDTLDSDLDIGTLLVETSSHPVTYEICNGNDLYFRFDNILLPDSNVNEPGSNGFVRYSISPKPGLAEYTTATNTAYIFFDFNPAVVTNTTLNTFVSKLTVSAPGIQIRRSTAVAFPNPSSENIYINLPERMQGLRVYNSNGEMVKEIIPEREVAEIDISDLPKGFYAVRIDYAGGVITTKFVKE